MKIETLLHEEIKSEFEELKKIEVGSDQYKVAVDGVTKLVDKAIEIDRLNIEHQEKVDARLDENYFKNEEIKENRKDQTIKNCITIGGIIVPVVITVWGTLKSFEFEREGTVTTIMGRGFINKLLPKK